jgi:hypothetical protein
MISPDLIFSLSWKETTMMRLSKIQICEAIYLEMRWFQCGVPGHSPAV